MLRSTRIAPSERGRGCIIVALMALLFVAGCATTSELQNVREEVTSTTRIEMLNQKKDIETVKARLAELSKDVQRLNERTEGVAKESTISALKESQSSLLITLGDISKEVQNLKGRMDESKYFTDKAVKDLISEREVQQARIASLEKELKDLREKFSAALTEVKDTLAKQKEPAPGPVPEEKSPEAKAPATPEAAANTAEKLYDDAHVDFQEKRFGEARQKFERITKDFPKHELAPNAYFWIGETYYADKKFEDAILAYETLLKKYPKHDKARGGMLKQAYAFVEIGDKKTAKVILERLLEKYPTSHEAELAQKKISEIFPKTSAKPKPKKKSTK